MKKEWLKTNIRQVHMDFHMPEFPEKAIDNFNAKEFVNNLEYGHINMVAIFAKCHFGNSFYDTKKGYGHKHSGLKNDFLKETVNECRKKGIKTVAYYSLNTDIRAYKKFPHWRAINIEGEPSGISGPWAFVCINTPYKEEMVLPQLKEIIKGYAVDGIFIDIPFTFLKGDCLCKYCKEKYKQLYGQELNKETSEVDRMAFGQNSAGRFLKELRFLCNQYNPDLRILTNKAWRIESSRAFSQESDYGVWESQPRSNYLSHSFACRSVRTLDALVQVMSVRFYQGWGDLTLKPAAQMITEFAAMIGNGCPASSGDQVKVDGTLQAPVYDMFKQAFGFVKEREDILIGAKSITDTAIIAPVPYPDKPAPNAVGSEMMGAHKALIENHVQFDILNALDIDKIDNYKYIVLTEPYDFDSKIFSKIKNWVSAGGTLIAVGRSLLHDGEFELEDVLGIKYLEPSVFSVSYFSPVSEIQGNMDEISLQCRGRSQKVLLNGAKKLADFIYPQTESVPEHSFRHTCPPPSDEKSPYPFATINKFGDGKGVYIAGSIFKVYWDYNHHWLRQFIDSIFSYVNPEPIYKVEAPPIVETNMMENNDGDLLLNLIHYQVGHQGSNRAIPSIEVVYPLTNIKCRVKVDNVKKVVLEPEGEQIDFTKEDKYISFNVPELKYLAIIRIIKK